jgi:hypothetical protein
LINRYIIFRKKFCKNRKNLIIKIADFYIKNIFRDRFTEENYEKCRIFMNSADFKLFKIEYAKREKVPDLLAEGKIIDFLHQCKLEDGVLVAKVIKNNYF